jgi:hypothetical protein
MALVRTTLSSAVGVNDTTIRVADATGFSAGYVIRIDQENLRVAKTYVSGTTIPVTRGQDGTVQAAHVVTAGVVCGVATDWSDGGPQTDVGYPIAGKARQVQSITATSTLTLPPAGTDLVVILNGTSVITLTVPVPTKDMDGTMLWIAGNGAAAHVLTFTGGLSGAGSGYTLITVNATKPITVGPFIAVNSVWNSTANVPLAGTVTAVTGTVS